MWYDERFKKTNISSKDVDMCYINPEQIDDLWKPDIFIDRAMDEVSWHKCHEVMQILLHFKYSKAQYKGRGVRPGSVLGFDMSSGTFTYILNEHLTINCQMNFEKYPMDEHICYLKITSLLLGGDQLVTSSVLTRDGSGSRLTS